MNLIQKEKGRSIQDIAASLRIGESLISPPKVNHLTMFADIIINALEKLDLQIFQ